SSRSMLLSKRDLFRKTGTHFSASCFSGGVNSGPAVGLNNPDNDTTDNNPRAPPDGFRRKLGYRRRAGTQPEWVRIMPCPQRRRCSGSSMTNPGEVSLVFSSSSPPADFAAVETHLPFFKAAIGQRCGTHLPLT